MSNTTTDWFAVDKEGLGQLLARRGAWFAVYELVQNAIDETGVTAVDITLESLPGRPTARLIVADDAPDGFADLTHAFRLFAPSKKKGDAEKRGRFNLGEKLVLAICDEAIISSTTGTYLFDSSGRQRLQRKTEHGSIFDGTIRMTRADVAEAAERVHSILPPAGIRLTFNGVPVEYREPLHSMRINLPTEIADDEGRMKRTHRTTTVEVHEPVGDEQAMIYEMGIPVVESGDRWHVNIGQKVPLNMDRDNVTPAYLAAIRVAVLNEMHDRVDTAETASQTWVTAALADPNTSPEAVRDIVATRFGVDAVIFDPSDPEANKIAAAQGRTVIPPGTFSRAAWSNIRQTEAFRPAGQVTPSAKVLTSPDGKPPLDPDQWTPGMRRIVAYAESCAQAVLGFPIGISICSEITAPWAACYGGRHLRLNVGRLGHRWFNEPDVTRVDELLIHEFGHEYSSDHLSSAFYDALCKVGARMKANAEQLDVAWEAAKVPA